MKEITGDLFRPRTYSENIEPDVVFITTNGFVKKSNGECVMGRGCAKEAAKMFPQIPKMLGDKIKANGNKLQGICSLNVSNRKVHLGSFPVKSISETCSADKSNVVKHMQDKFKSGDRVPGWACKARLDIIEDSAKQLAALLEQHAWKHVIIVRPGCGFGELKWEDVKPILDKHLNDKVYSITF